MNRANCEELKQKVIKKAYAIPSETRNVRTYRVRRTRTSDSPPEPGDSPDGVSTRGVDTSGAITEFSRMNRVPVAAVGIAPRGKRDYKLAVRIYAGQERHEQAILQGLDRYPNEVDLASGVRYTLRQTIRAGGSCGHYQSGAGTLGGFVEDNDGYYLLSNNHVLANSNSCMVGDPILQPGPGDYVGNQFKIIGATKKWHPLSTIDNYGVDAALASFDSSVKYFYPWDYAGIGTILSQPIGGRYSVSKVVKRGRTTKVTHGHISAYDLDGVTVNYGTYAVPVLVTFDNQIEIVGDPPAKRFSWYGDSGSFILDEDTLAPYALLFSGSVDSQGIDRTVAHFMPSVLSALKVRLVQ